jgi:hypothetical protein
MLEGIELYFDPQTEARVRALWAGLSQAGLPSPLEISRYRPGLTMMVAPSFQRAPLIEALRELAFQQPVLPLTFSSLGVFPQSGALFLAPVVTEPLLRLHQAVWQRLCGLATEARPNYAPGFWVPHCSLGFRLTPEQLRRASELSLSIALPIKGQCESLSAVRLTAGEASELVGYPLTGR